MGMLFHGTIDNEAPEAWERTAAGGALGYVGALRPGGEPVMPQLIVNSLSRHKHSLGSRAGNHGRM